MKNSTAVLGALGIILIIIGLLSFILSDQQIRLAETNNWPSTNGVIISSDVGIYRGTRRDIKLHYVAEIEFSYTVNNITYTSDRLNLFNYHTDFSDKSQAQRIVDNYYVGRNVTVYYDPSLPSLSVLELGGNWASPLLLTTVSCSLIFIGIAIFPILIFLSHHRNKKN